jgi:serine/threonine-protein kinase
VAEFEKYEKKRLLGTNQYGAIHEAFDFGLSRSVAILEFHLRFRQDPETWRGIWREVTERSQIEHDNLISPLTSVESEGQVILPFMRDNFGRRLAESPVPYDSVRTAVKCALQGLACLHANGKVHGYITPANLLYGADDRIQSVKVSFSPGLFLGGVVPIKGRDQKSLAPEMFNEQLFGPIGHSVDLYCLGFAAYEMVRGKAFADLIPGAEINKNAYEAFHASPGMRLPSLTNIDPKAPPDLVRVIDRLLQKCVGDRYATADDALKDLDLQVRDSYEPVASTSAVAESAVTGTRLVQDAIEKPLPASSTPSRSPAATPANNQKKVQKAAATPARSNAITKLNDTAKRIWEKHWAVVTAAAGMLTVFAVLSIASLFTAQPDVTVSIVSEPQGATVMIGEDKLKEKTPTTAVVKPGTVELSWEMRGYKSGKEKFEIKPPADNASQKSHEQVLHLTLMPTEITIPLTVTPRTAVVKVDGKAQVADKSGKYQLGLLPGSHELVVELKDYETHTATFEAATQDKLDVKLVAKPKAPDPEPIVGRVPTTKPPVASPIKLPQGLVAIDGSPVHSSLGLPLRVVAENLKEYLKPGELPLELILIDSGSFTYGAADPLEGELAQSSVDILTPYYIATSETTVAQFAAWKKFAQKPDHDANPPNDSKSNVDSPGGSPPKDDAQPEDPSAANRPAVMVPFGDAQKFCLWIAPDAGRLPSEIEWERAGRGTDARIYPWGNDPLTAEKCRLASASDKVTDNNMPAGPVGVRDLPSGAAIISPPGAEIYHLLGNVAEWCDDFYVPGANETESTPGVAKNHVIRGASFLEPVSDRIRLTWRANVDAKGAPDVGFRVLVSIPKFSAKPGESKDQKAGSTDKSEGKPATTETK